jgi:hypothetical protein
MVDIRSKTGTAQVVAILLVGAMLAMMGAANAANITPRCDNNGCSVFLAGEIKSGDDKKFHRIVAPLPNTPILVWLQSPGGDVVAGINIGEEIHARRFDTAVINYCASVCGLIWLAGTNRVVDETAHIGFHAAYDASDGQVSPEANAWIGAYLSHLGFSYTTIEFLTRTSPDSMQWITADLAARYGIRALIMREQPSTMSDGPARNKWWMFIPAIVMGIFTIGFIAKTRPQKCAN